MGVTMRENGGNDRPKKGRFIGLFAPTSIPEYQGPTAAPWGGRPGPERPETRKPARGTDAGPDALRGQVILRQCHALGATAPTAAPCACCGVPNTWKPGTKAGRVRTRYPATPPTPETVPYITISTGAAKAKTPRTTRQKLPGHLGKNPPDISFVSACAATPAELRKA